MFTLEAIRMATRRNLRPRAYAVMSNGETVAIVLKKVGAWKLSGKKMHAMFPSRIHSKGTAYRSFKTIHELREWLASDQPTKYFKV